MSAVSRLVATLWILLIVTVSGRPRPVRPVVGSPTGTVALSVTGGVVPNVMVGVGNIGFVSPTT